MFDVNKVKAAADTARLELFAGGWPSELRGHESRIQIRAERKGAQRGCLILQAR